MIEYLKINLDLEENSYKIFYNFVNLINEVRAYSSQDNQHRHRN